MIPKTLDMQSIKSNVNFVDQLPLIEFRIYDRLIVGGQRFGISLFFKLAKMQLNQIYYNCQIIFQKMNFIQEFTEQQLSKTNSSNILQQIQTCHSAVEDLICNLQALRSSPKLDIIQQKIGRYQAYLATKQDLLDIYQNNQSLSLIEWLIDNKISSPLVIETIKRQQFFMGQQLQKTIKQVFLSQQSLEQFLEENQMVSNCLEALRQIMQEINLGRSPTREKIKIIDSYEGIIEEKIVIIQNKIIKFSIQIDKIARQLQDFEHLIIQQFRQYLTRENGLRSSKLIEKHQKSTLIPEKDSKFTEQNLYENPLSKTTQGFANRYSLKKQPTTFRNNYVEGRSSLSKQSPSNHQINLGLQSRINIASQLKRQSHSNLQKSLNSSLMQSFTSNPYR